MADIKLVYQDERLTTVMAEKVLIDADVSRKKRNCTVSIKDARYNIDNDLAAAISI